MKRDGHIHSPYCPHGTKDALKMYIEKAIQSGFTDISFTEHAPLPRAFSDPTPMKDSGMAHENLHLYLDAVNGAKDAYKNDILIRTGLEVDYLAGYEDDTREFLNEVGPLLDDSILSVHFLKAADRYYCADYSKDVFMDLANAAGTVEAVYELYYDTLEASLFAELGRFKPKRIGHPTLVHKFQLAHGEKIDDSQRIKCVFEIISRLGYEIDFNGAGFSKPDCLEPYPPLKYVPLAQSMCIPLVFGSDAHSADGLHKHYEKLYNK